MNVAHAIDAFLENHDVLASSKETYHRSLQNFFQWLDDNKIFEPKPEHITAYKTYLTKKKLSPLSISSYLIAVKQFFRWAQGSGVYSNIAEHVKAGSGSKKGWFGKDALTAEQVITMLSSIDRTSPVGLRDYAMMNLMVRVGLRSIEVVRANIEDLQQKDNRHILWVQGKGRLAKDEFVVLNTDSLEPIKDYLRTRPSSRAHSPLFVSASNRNNDERLTTRSIRRVAKNIFKDIDLDSPRLTCHSLRHTAVTLALKGGAPIRQTQRMARHASVLTTERYAHDLETLESPAEDAVAEILKLTKKR